MKCMSSCFSCLCGTKNSARVTPSDPLQIVQANSAKHHSHYRSTSGEDNHDGGRVNPNFTVGEGEDCSSSLSDENSAVKALFIEVGKDRLLRVIHIRSFEDEPSPSRKGSVDGQSNSDSKGSPASPDKSETSSKSPAPVGQGAEGDDDEDEYWFSKWARKPRFRNIFAKNPENRHKLGGGGESNNNNGISPEENGKVSVELEMARAAAAAKRRAWAYNNNGNSEPTINQQPTVSMGDEEEFSSIAIVNTTKQQWSKQGMNDSSNKTPESSKKKKDEKDDFSSPSPASSSKVKVEIHSDSSSSSLKEGISNLAFEGDDDEKSSDDEYDDCGYNKTDKPNTSKSSVSSSTSDKNTAMTSTQSRSSSIDSSKKEEEDAITTEEPHSQKQQSSPTSSSKTATPTSSQTDNIAPRKPLLFFVHSVAGSSDVWHHQYEFFQQLGYEIVAPDLLGHGLSSTPLNPKYYLFESLVQDLILIFDHFCKEDVKVVLIGHGYG